MLDYQPKILGLRPLVLGALLLGAFVVLGLVLWIVALIERQPTVSDGLGAALVVVTFVVAAANAGFLYALVQQVRLNRFALVRSATPYLRVERWGPEVWTPSNHGQGLAREIRAWRVVIRSRDEGQTAARRSARRRLLQA